MRKTSDVFKLFSNETRLRTLMLLTREELCVCQVMAVLGVSQPLVSRNLAILADAGLLTERRDGKLVFYVLKKNLEAPLNKIVKILKDELKTDDVFLKDLGTVDDCQEFQKKSGKCDMKTFLRFMEERRKIRGK
jgi:ArsR family transcriptional regulator